MQKVLKKKAIWIVTFLVGIIAIAFGTGFVKIHSQRQAIINAAAEKKNIAAELAKVTWVIYQNKAGNYTVHLPNFWKGVEKRLPGLDSYVIFTQPMTNQTLGSISTTSITVQTDPNTKQSVTTQDAFDTWYKKPNSASPKDGQRFHKLNNTTINGAKGVILLDLGETTKQKNGTWSLVTWFRRDKTNYYINTRGNKKLSLLDLTVYDAIVSSFIFK